jgi:hypothetical protein
VWKCKLTILAAQENEFGRRLEPMSSKSTWATYQTGKKEKKNTKSQI